MFLYPALYSAGVFAGMDDRTFGIFVGGTIHEVAQVVAVGGAYGKEASDAAVIVKMTRVIMIAPMLILLGMYLSYVARKSGAAGGGVKLVIPWFAVYFVGMAGVNSLLTQYSASHAGDAVSALIQSAVENINIIDTFLLTMAMTALGMGTRFAKFKGLGLAPLYTAGAMFAWLLIGGYFITTWVVATF